MKKILLVIAAMVLITFASSCKGNLKILSGEEDSFADSTADTELSFDSIEVSDSIVFSKKDRVEASIKCQYPVSGEQFLKDSIIAWINEDVLVDNNGKSLADASADIMDNLKSVIASYLKADSIEATDMLRINRSAEFDTPVEYDHDMEVEVAYEDDDYVTMSYTVFVYMAGAAHGSTLAGAATFSKKDGHRMGWELTSDYSKEQLTKLVKDGLKKYFEVSTDKDLRECLLDVDEDTYNTAFPMPKTPPYILKDGIHLTYQQYEIGPYAVGMPDVTIPMKK